MPHTVKPLSTSIWNMIYIWKHQINIWGGIIFYQLGSNLLKYKVIFLNVKTYCMHSPLKWLCPKKKKLKKIKHKFCVDIIQVKSKKEKYLLLWNERLFYHSENVTSIVKPSAPRFGGDCFIFTVSPAMGMALLQSLDRLVSVTFKVLIFAALMLIVVIFLMNHHSGFLMQPR